jgi:hypothetical protein
VFGIVPDYFREQKQQLTCMFSGLQCGFIIVSQANTGGVNVLPTVPHGIKRSERYAICAPLKYRIRGERVWHPGVGRNMSESGILFEGAAPLTPGAQFEAQLTLAPAVGGKKGTVIRFHGTVVRSPQEGLWAARIFTPRLRHLDASRADAGQPKAPTFFAPRPLGSPRLHQPGAERAPRLPRAARAVRGAAMARRRPWTVAADARVGGR